MSQRNLFPFWCRVVAALALACPALPTLAQLSNPVQVRLVAPGGVVGDPTPLELIQSLGLGAAIAQGGGGPIASFMLPLERIELTATSLLLRVAQGDASGGTGLLGSGGNPARYEFRDLAAAGRYLTGATPYAFDGFGTSGSFSGLQSGLAVSLLDSNADGFADRLQFNLSSLLFKNRGLGESNNFAEFRVDLQTAPIPEPATVALLLGGLLVVGAAASRRPQRLADRR